MGFLLLYSNEVAMMNDYNLRSLNEEELEEVVVSLGEKKFRAKQLFSWVHEKNAVDFNEMSNLSLKFREKLTAEYNLGESRIIARQISQDTTEKYLLELADNAAVECVLMRYRGDFSKKRNTLCISSQVGCAMGCTFCATAQGGFVRNLTAGEIVGQVYEVNHILSQEGDERVDNVVFMGMGEPLLNWDNVLKAIHLLNDKDGQNIGIRRMSLSTCGIADRIRDLADSGLDITLAVSLHAATDEKRSQIMPINKRYPLGILMEACRYYQKKTKKRITFEYALIKGVNDTAGEVMEIKRLLNDLDAHVNLIPVNPVANTKNIFRPSQKNVKDFAKMLKKSGVNCSIREEKGTDIDGACGQLRGKLLKN